VPYLEQMGQTASKSTLIVKGLFVLFLGWMLAQQVVSPKFLFVDNFNLMMHEAGHLIFGFGGETLSFLGGTLIQLLIPIMFLIYFAWIRREAYASGVMVFWLGENIANVGIYMADAVKQRLPLVGGGIHDWGYLFGRWDILPIADKIGNIVMLIGFIVMFVSLLWLGGVVLHQWSNEESA
jgi:hypothetical protein